MNAISPPIKQYGQSMCFRCMQNMMQKSILSETGKAHHDHQNSGQAKQRPENER